MKALTSFIQFLSNRKFNRDLFNGAAIIRDDGKEIPITEKMIQDACKNLENHNHYPSKQHKLRKSYSG